MTRCGIAACTVLDPVVGEGALVCERCQRALVRQLGEIEDYLHLVSPERLQRGAERGSPGYHSASPAADNVIAMFDPRSKLNGGFDDSAPEDDYENAPDHVVPVVSTIVGWAQLVVDELDLDDLPATLEGAVQLLRGRAGWMCEQGWIGDAADEIGRVHRQLAAAVADLPDKPIAMCIEIRREPCQGAVFWVPGRDEARCFRCGRPYAGLDLVRLRVAQEAS